MKPKMRPNRKRFYAQVLAYHRDHPGTNNAALGRIFKICRERVRQILRDHPDLVGG